MSRMDLAVFLGNAITALGEMEHLWEKAGKDSIQAKEWEELSEAPGTREFWKEAKINSQGQRGGVMLAEEILEELIESVVDVENVEIAGIKIKTDHPALYHFIW